MVKFLKKSLKKIQIILSIVFLLFIIPIIHPVFPYNSNKIQFLKLSANGINLITPENKTYTSAMSGYYPATYGFENDEVGTFPEDWVDASTGIDCYIEVINEFNGHKNIVKIDDQSNGDWAVLQKDFTLLESPEIIEFWYYPKLSSYSVFDIWDGANNILNMQFEYPTHDVRYWNGTDYIYIYFEYIEQWYHIKIELDYDNDKFNIYFDGIKYGEDLKFQNPASECKHLRFTSWGSGPGSTGITYVDAVGFSSDANYNIRDNFHEGLLLSFESDENLDWIGFSLDIQNNKTILGNTTIPLPSNGTHTIQIYGNDSIGVNYQSDIRYFTIYYTPINIIKPENITYFDPMSGYYPATYGFENDKNGFTPYDWDIWTSGADCSAKVIDEFSGHKKVVQLLDQSDSAKAQIGNQFPSSLKLSTLEFWYFPDVSCHSDVTLYNYGTQFIYLQFLCEENRIRYFDGSYHPVLNNYIEKWYHIRFDIDYNNNNYDIFIDGNKLIDDANFRNNVDGCTSIVFSTWLAISGEVYIDGIGLSTDINYIVGDNVDEGILLSFEDDTNLIWAEYSLDNQDKQSILGNTTFKVPEDGVHSIKVFGRDSSGDLYESNMVYFNISIAPYIKWVSPSENQHIIFPIGDPIFYIQYSFRKLVNATLEINSIDFGSVWNKSSIDLSPYNGSIDGVVTAILYGYEEGNPIPIVSDTRDFTFSKVISDITELLDYGTEFIGEKLYLILHDPPGDNSFSGYAESTSLSIGINSHFTQSHGFGVEAEGSLFGVGLGASANIKATWSTESQYQFKVTDVTELISSVDNYNKDFIGPGYGDRYWGEAISYSWNLKAFYRTYFNGTQRYEKPTVYWGLTRSGESFLNDYNVPNNWRNLNPVHNNYSNVDWKNNLTIAGGSPFSKTYTTVTSNKRIDSFQINFDASVTAILGPISLTYSMGLEWQNQQEYGNEQEFKTSFTINDDESTDQISLEYGIDKLFSTYIFRTHPVSCMTSNPLEYDTFDYVPPILEFPNINLDSNHDGLAPCMDDSPIITVEIEDEGGIQVAYIFFSINNGFNWDSAFLSEHVANPGTWEGIIPAHPHGTSVLWYIETWDVVGSNTVRKDPQGNPYSYTVINRAPEVSIITPNGAEAFKNEITIQWSAFDLDGDSLIYALAYNDAGKGWRLISTNLTDNSYIWDVSNIPYSDSISIKVIAYDGYGGISEDTSDFIFTIEGPKPDAFEFPFFETMSIVSIGIAVFAAVVVLRKTRLTSK